MNARRRLADSADLTAIEAGGLRAFQPYDSVPQALEAVAAQHARRPAISWLPSADIIEPAQRWTYAELMRRVRQAANLLHELGVDDEHAVALLLPAVPQAWLVLLGGETAGRVCPINYLLDTAHIAALVTAANARVLVALAPCPEVDIASKAARLRGLCPGLERVLWVGGDPPNVDNTDGADHFEALLAAQPADALVFDRSIIRDTIAATFHTGGTTGAPKLAQHSHIDMQRTRRRGPRNASPAQYAGLKAKAKRGPSSDCRLDPRRPLQVARRADLPKREERMRGFALSPFALVTFIWGRK